MNITFKQLKYISAAASLRSISRAAEQLYISQSSIGAAIDRAESEFGIQIFVRQPSKGLILTNSGQQLLQQINELLSNMENFFSDATNLKSTLDGELNVGCFAPLSPHILPPILQDLTKHYPNISVHFHEGNLRQVQEFLLDGIVDVVLTYDLGISERIVCEAISEVPLYVVLPQGDPLGKQKSVALEDLIDRPMVLFDLPESRTYFELVFDLLQYRPKIVYRTEAYETVRGIVAAGLGFSLLNLRPASDTTYTGAKVICRPLRNMARTPKIIIGLRRKCYPTQLMGAFLGSCRKYFRTAQAARHIVTN